MYRIDNATSVTTAPDVSPAGTEKFWTNGDPGAGVAATKLDSWWFNMIQEEIRKVVVDAGLIPNKNDNTQLSQAIQNRIAAAGSGIPSGTLHPWPTDTVPEGYLLCDGVAVSRTIYSALFAVIGTTYGAGNGSTTFNLPDLRGRFPLGKDDMGGTSANRVIDGQADVLGGFGGTETHTLTVAEMPNHAHSYSVVSSSGSGMNFNGSGDGPVASNTGSAGSSQAHNNMPPYMTLNYIIKV
jgi:microcystin-dependent protein